MQYGSPRSILTTFHGCALLLIDVRLSQLPLRFLAVLGDCLPLVSPFNIYILFNHMLDETAPDLVTDKESQVLRIWKHPTPPHKEQPGILMVTGTI